MGNRPKTPIHRFIPAVIAVLLTTGLGIGYLRALKPAAAREVQAACRGMWPTPVNESLGALPTQAPRFEAQDEHGNRKSLADFSGKTTLINFWASWCNVCKAEKPSLIELANTMGDDLNIVTIASDKDWTEIQKMFPNGPPFTVLLDPPIEGNLGPIARAYGITAVPESFIIDKDGVVRRYFVNRRNWSSALSRTCLESML